MVKAPEAPAVSRRRVTGMDHQQWIGTVLIALFSLVSIIRLARQRTITRNLLVLCITSVLCIFGLLGVYPALISFSGIEIQLKQARNDLALEQTSAGIDSGIDDQRIELNGTELFITEAGLEEPVSDNTRIVNFKYLFSIDQPPEGSGLIYHESTVQEYAKKMVGTYSTRLTDAPTMRDAHVFRVVSSQEIQLRVGSHSYKGDRVSRDEYTRAWRVVSDDPTGEPPDVQQQRERAAEMVKRFPDTQAEDDIENSPQSDKKWIEEATLRSEVAIVVFDRANFETVLTGSHGGRKVAATALNFLLSSGGTLPYFDPLDVLQTDVSRDNNVWAFHVQTKLNDVEVNGEPTEIIYLEHYRFYVLNDAYIYQVILTRIHTPDQPSVIWTNLMDSLASLRIVKHS